MLSVANVFQNHMVLQRNKPLRIWGTAEPFASVQAVLGTECAAVRADADGVWALELVSRTVPNAWMTTSGDAGMQWDIHPKCKKPIGQRLALLALGHVYGKELLCDAPELLQAEKRDGGISLRFAHAEGLYLDRDLFETLELLGRSVTV